MYALIGWTLPIARAIAPNAVTTSVILGRALVNVARDGHNFSWVGQLMMRPAEWQDFTRRFGLREGDDGVWRSDES